MARKRRSSSSSAPPSYSHYVGIEPRETPAFAITRPDASRPVMRFGISPLLVSGRSLRVIEDRRTFHPDPYRPAATLRSSRHRLRVHIPLNAKTVPLRRWTARSAVPARIGFVAPTSVLVCVRRRTRREVLHAYRRVGAGTRRRRARRSTYSNIVCRRH